MMKSPIARGIALGLATGATLILLLGVGVFFVTGQAQTLATSLPAEHVVGFVRTSDPEKIRHIAQSYGIALEKDRLPAGILEAALLEDNEGRGWMVRSAATKQISVSDPRWNLPAVDLPTLGETAVFEASKRDRVAYDEWIYMKTTDLTPVSEEEQTLLSLLSGYDALLSLRNPHEGIVYLEGDMEQEEHVLGRKIDAPNTVYIRNASALLQSAHTGSDLSGMLGILEAKAESILPESGSGMRSLASMLMDMPVSLTLSRNGTGTDIFVVLTPGATSGSILETVLNHIPQAQIRTTELREGVTRTDVISAEIETENIHGWTIFRMENGWFLAERNEAIAYGNDEALLARPLHMTTEVSSGMINRGLWKADIVALFPFFSFEPVSHPVFDFLRSDADLSWQMREQGNVRRLHWQS